MLTLLCSVMSWAEEATLSTMATSGTIVEDIITFSTAANGSNTPQISSSQLRLYANTSADMSTGEKGGSITFTAAEGYVINQVTLAIANDGNSNTTAGYQVDGTGSWIGSENNVVKNTNYSTGDNLGARTVEIANFGTTTKSNRIYITSITVKYTAVAKEIYTVTLGDDNSTLVQANISEAVKLPSRSDIGDYKFAGWSTTNVTEETTTAPAIIKSGDYVPKANITLYPVYSKDEGIPNQTVSVNVAEYAAAHNWTVLASGSATKDTHCKYEIDINDDVKVTTNDNNVNGAVYADGWRIYQSYNGTVNVTTTAGSLVSVKFTYTNGNSGQLFYGEDQLTSNTAIDVEGTSADFKVIRTGSTNTNGQVKITAIEVNYGSGVTYYTSVPVAPTPTYASLDELIDANLEETTVVNVTLTDEEVNMAMTHPQLPGMYIVVLNHMATIGAPGSDLGWIQGGTVSGTLENVTWDPEEKTLTSESDFWSSLEYTAPAGAPQESITLYKACNDGEFYYSTYSSANAFYVPNDLIVYEVMEIDGEIAFEPYEPGALVPPYTGVLVGSIDFGTFYVDVETDNDMIDGFAESVLGEDNALRPTCFEGGVTAEDMSAEDPGMKYYRLTMHNGTQCGFWWGAAEGAAFNIAENKAYLVAGPAVNKAKGFSFKDITTGIEKAMAEKANNKVRYNLNGQRVNANAKGIIIVNGKKVIKK